MKNILVTGGAGFIGNLENLKDIENKQNYTFIKCDICDLDKVKAVFKDYKIDSVIHLAAESHVDRSIADPFSFAKTNVMGTLSLLQAAKDEWKNNLKNNLFYHVSTDEVYGSLNNEGFFTGCKKTDSPFLSLTFLISFSVKFCP